MKKLLSITLSALLVFSLVACDGSDASVLEDEISTVVSDTTSDVSEPATEPISFVLTAGEAGEYGKLITYNKGTEFEETFYAFYVPEGTYTVTNKGEYMSQINVYSDETRITEDGWEEVAESFDIKLLDVGASGTITVGAGQHIEIAEPSVFELVQQ